jgi:hypothetical protein
MNDQHCGRSGTAENMGPPGPEESGLLNAMLADLARPSAPIEKIIIGSKLVAVCAGGRIGLSSLLGARPTEEESHRVMSLIGQTVADGAAYLLQQSPFSICIGLASLNAANTPDSTEVSPTTQSAETLIAELGAGARVALVGQFPFTRSLRQQVKHLDLFELNDVPDAVPRHRWDATLAQADVLALTATTLLTRQMTYYLSRANQATIVILGPSTPLSRPLFDYGADYLCGSVVTDGQRVGKSIQAGLGFRGVKQRGGLVFTQWTS